VTPAGNNHAAQQEDVVGQTREPTGTTAGAAAGGTARVLVIDDDEHVLGLLTEVLTGEGYDVVGAMDGAAAVAAIRTQRPDLILLDLMMPVLDGWSFLELYRQLPGPHVPVIVLTAAAQEARVEAEGRADSVVPKPFSVDRVLALVNQYTGRTASHGV